MSAPFLNATIFAPFDSVKLSSQKDRARRVVCNRSDDVGRRRHTIYANGSQKLETDVIKRCFVVLERVVSALTVWVLLNGHSKKPNPCREFVLFENDVGPIARAEIAGDAQKRELNSVRYKFKFPICAVPGRLVCKLHGDSHCKGR